MNIVFEVQSNFYKKLSIVRGKRRIGINSFAKEIIENVIDTAIIYLEGKDNRNKEYFFKNGILQWREKP